MYSLRVNDIMATRNFRASDIVEALFDKNLGLDDSESSSDNDEDERIQGYLGNSFFAPSGNHYLDSELTQDEDLSSSSESEDLYHKDISPSSKSISDVAVNDAHQSPAESSSAVTSHNEQLDSELASCPMDSMVSLTLE